MRALLAFSRAVDAMNDGFGRIADWAVLAACAISAGNAFVRYGFSMSSNAWLEVQWYLFAATVMLGAAYTLNRNEHVRVDLVYGSVPAKARLWIDIFGLIFFLLPGMVLLAWMTWPFFWDSFVRGEGSPNAGGLLRWPVKILMPIGFALVSLQGLSELVKRIAALRGVDPTTAQLAEYHRPEQ